MKRLMAEFDRGFDVTNLHKMRQFCRMYEIRDTVRLVSAVEAIRHMACNELSWSQYILPIEREEA